MPKKFNHRQKIKKRQPAKIKSVRSGMILEFDYKAKDIFDKRPLILVLYNEYFSQRRRGKNVLIHSINLNYLTEYKVQQLLQEKTIKKLEWYELYDQFIRSYSKSEIKNIKKVKYRKDTDAS